MDIQFVGCPAPYREAVELRLTSGEYEPFVADERRIVLVHCDRAQRWDELELAVQQGAVSIAVLPELAMDHYVKALILGAAGVVQFDTPSAITADVVRAAVQGEVLVPRHVAHSMALLAERLEPRTDLDTNEIDLLQSLATGATVVDLAAENFFSERTLRRHLQGLYLKLGVRNRAEAIAAASRTGLIG